MRKEVESISMNEYDYPLPDERIARYPLEDRASCKLLHYNQGSISSHSFYQIVDLLPKGAMLVRNNTRVIRARIHLQKATGAQIEILCLEPASPSQYECSLSATEQCSWYCMTGNARRWKEGALKRTITPSGEDAFTFRAERLSGDVIRFSWDNPNYSFGQLLEYVGTLPIPPYLRRETEEKDNQDYQTIYAVNKGSVAAPTAGLHFTDKEFDALAKASIPVAEVTLHVGAGTFLPVKSNEIGGHTMHHELCIVQRTTIEQLLQGYAPIIAVGTTSVRTLESLYYIGLNHLAEIGQTEESDTVPVVSQWEPYSSVGELPSTQEVLQRILNRMNEKGLNELIFSTALLIAPSYQFHIVTGLVTNFHQPHSTLLLMIGAFIGEDWKRVYQYALDNDYRFLSYGDGSLLLPKQCNE